MVQVLPQVLLLEAVVAVVHVLLVLLAVGQQGFAAVEADSLLGEGPHGQGHLLPEPEVYEEAALGVDKVVCDARRDVLEPCLRLEDEAVQCVHRWRRHRLAMRSIIITRVVGAEKGSI